MAGTDLITRLAREAGFRREGVAFFSTSAHARDEGAFTAVLDEALQRFAALVAEEAAKVIDEEVRELINEGAARKAPAFRCLAGEIRELFKR